MLYLNEAHIKQLGIDWTRSIDVIERAVHSLGSGDFNQPIKPYLRFPNPRNRIIAMPAFVGGDVNVAGIKWIASFPGNIERGLLRANSVTVLNDADTGVPFAIINTSRISAIRTASVSGLMLREFDKVRPLAQVEAGIIGFGPIGQLHLQMMNALLGERLAKVKLYDLKGVSLDQVPAELLDKVEVVDSWEAAYENSDVFITCTVSAQGYIDREPKAGSLLLNVSLRDFKPSILDYTQALVVDDWEEVCRENTDIDFMHRERGLQKDGTKSIAEVVGGQALKGFPAEQAILFNPMGMGVFDVATASDYVSQAQAKGIGFALDAEEEVTV